jgi:Ca-activated chloride channel family protein
MNAMKIILLVAMAALSADAQQLLSEPAPESRAVLRVDANLVLVPVTVTNNRGAVISDLDRNSFVVSEEKRPQTIFSFSHETAPISLGIVVDLSGSMDRKISKVHVALDALLDSLQPEDEEFLVTFADTAELRLPFTPDPSSIRGALSFVRARGSTGLFDAVALGVKQMHSARNARRVLFLISDGGDNHSRLRKRELDRMLDEEDVQIHAIGIHDHMASQEESRGPWILEELARITGGQHHMVENIDELPRMAGQMSWRCTIDTFWGTSLRRSGNRGRFAESTSRSCNQLVRSRLTCTHGMDIEYHDAGSIITLLSIEFGILRSAYVVR